MGKKSTAVMELVLLVLLTFLQADAVVKPQPNKLDVFSQALNEAMIAVFVPEKINAGYHLDQHDQEGKLFAIITFYVNKKTIPIFFAVNLDSYNNQQLKIVATEFATTALRLFKSFKNLKTEPKKKTV